jgi:hypothetical protein
MPEIQTASCELAVGSLKPKDGGNLSTLPARIKSAYGRAIAGAKQSLERARATGELLLEAKAAVGHGKFLPWLAAHCPQIPERVAQRWMRLAEHWSEIESKSDAVSDLTVTSALRLIEGPPFPWVEGRDAFTYSNGKLIVIHRSEEHPGHVHWSIVDTNEWFTEASSRPCHADSLHLFLNALGAEPDAEWRSDEAALETVRWVREYADQLRNEEARAAA